MVWHIVNLIKCKCFIFGLVYTKFYNEYLEYEDYRWHTDIAYKGKLISDQVIIQFPEYTFSEARSKAYNLSIQCEFSDEGLRDRDKLQQDGMQISESSKYLLCRHDSQKNILDEFMSEMSKFQLASHIVHLDILKKRVAVWQDFENSELSLSEARLKNKVIVDTLDSRLQKKFSELREAN